MQQQAASTPPELLSMYQQAASTPPDLLSMYQQAASTRQNLRRCTSTLFEVASRTAQRYNMRRHSTLRASPMDSIAGQSPTYAETMKCIVDASKRAYGGLEVDRVQPGFSSNANRVLSIGGMVRTLIIKKGPHLSTWRAKNSNTVSAGENWSGSVFFVVRVNPAQTYGNSTYLIAERGRQGAVGPDKRGVWTRQQLQHIPSNTIFDDDSSDDGSDTDDDGGDEAVGQFNDALTADPRPPVRVGYRYKKGDVLMFKEQYFTARWNNWWAGGPVPPT